jgi:pyridoxal biosynthesis lyase PdxS
MQNMNITSAQYMSRTTNDSVDGEVTENVCIVANIDGEELAIPFKEGNRHYAEILRQVEEGTLTIEPADEPE